MIEFRTATQDDIDFVRQNPYEGTVKDYPYIEVGDNTITTIWGGVIVAVGGLVVHWEGMAEMWLILTADCLKGGLHGIAALTAIKNKTDELIAKNNIRRAQAAIRVDFPIAIKMIEYLGFHNETPDGMKYYFPDGCDGFRYARIIE